MSENNDFIKQLSQNLRPVSPLMSPEKRTILWLIVNISVLLGVMFIIKPLKAAILWKFTHVSFVIEFSLIFCSIVSMSYASFLSVVPGAISTKSLKFFFTPIVLTILWFTVHYFARLSYLQEVAHRPTCLKEILVYGFIPIAHIIWLVSKGFFTQRKPTFFLATTAAALVPALLMHISCMHNPQHVITYHLLPTFVISLVTFVICVLAIKKN